MELVSEPERKGSGGHLLIIAQRMNHYIQAFTVQHKLRGHTLECVFPEDDPNVPHWVRVGNPDILPDLNSRLGCQRVA